MDSLDAYAQLLDALKDAPADDERARRARIGRALLLVFDADVFVSCRSGASGSFTDAVWINMSDSNMLNYQQYFQFHDPLTPKMRALGRAARVSETMDPATLQSTEFYHDFLSLDGLGEGMNYFPAQVHPGTLDLRIWRTNDRPLFGATEVRLLQSSGELIEQLLPATPPAASSAPAPNTLAQIPALSLLTAREHQVAGVIARGLTDRAACKELRCSMSTLRTHLSKVFGKLEVGNRAELIALLAPHRP